MFESALRVSSGLRESRLKALSYFKVFFHTYSLIRLFILYLHTIFSLLEKNRKLFINVAGNQRNMDRFQFLKKINYRYSL